MSDQHFDHADHDQEQQSQSELPGYLYPWMRQVNWMRPESAVPATEFPAVTTPIVYEGFVPYDDQHNHHAHNLNTVASQYPEEPLFAAYQTSSSLQHGNEQGIDGYGDSLRATNFARSSDRDHTFQNTNSNGSRSRPSRNGSEGSIIRRLGVHFEEPDESNTETDSVPKPRKRHRGGRKGGSDPRSGTREALDPGDEFKALHGQATEAFLMGDIAQALELILEAISINPEINSAHVMLSEIYFAQGENDKAIAALFSGAHAAPNDPAGWQQAADACLQRSNAERSVALKQAAYCFTRLLNIDQDNNDARFHKALISRELGYHAKTLKDLDVIMKDTPHDPAVLKEYAGVCLETGQASRARSLYETCLEKSLMGELSGTDAFGWEHLIIHVDLVSQVEGVDRAIEILKEISRWLVGRADESFWNDMTEDDREWDLDHSPRRLEVGAFQPAMHAGGTYGAALPLELRTKLGGLRLRQGKTEEALSHFEWLEPEASSDGDNVFEYPDLFVQVAHQLRDFKELRQAARFYNALRNVQAEFDGEEEIQFLLGLAACSNAVGEKEQALQYYESIKQIDSENVEALTQLSKLYADKGLRALAIKTARSALEAHERALPRTNRRKYERKEAREARKEAQKALKYAYTSTKKPGEAEREPLPSFSRRARAEARRQERETREALKLSNTPADRPVERPKPKKRESKAQRTRDQEEAHVRQLYVTLCANTQAMREGDEEARSIWMEKAEALIEEFRSHRVFYPAERHKQFTGYGGSGTRPRPDDVGVLEDSLRSRFGGTVDADLPVQSVESTAPNDLYGIVFSSWLDIFLEYALQLANLLYEPSECYTIITAAQDCVVWYHDMDAMTQIYSCYVACALALQDEQTLFNVALRWFMREYAFCSDTYRLFAALNFYYPHNLDKGGKAGQLANAKFRVPPNQKFIFRHIVTIDAQLPPNYGQNTKYGPVPEFARKERPEVRNRRPIPVRQGRDDTSPNTSHSRTPDPSSTFLSTPSHRPPAPRSALQTFLPEEMDVVLLMLYGQILYAGGSFPSALSYMYRAHSLDPSNPTVLLSLALCYMHQMFKRQNENRHMYLLQGWALFEEYAAARLEQAKAKEAKGGRNGERGMLAVVEREIEFNRARCWHMVGLSDLALRSYKKMMGLKCVKKEIQEGEMDVDDGSGGVDGTEYNMEAAYAMATVYALNGDAETARSITEKWLVVE